MRLPAQSRPRQHSQCWASHRLGPLDCLHRPHASESVAQASVLFFSHAWTQMLWPQGQEAGLAEHGTE